MIQLRNISLSFGGQKVFDSISCTFNDNQRVGLVGNNGSGKSTLFKVIMGQHPIDDGHVALLSKKKIAYMPQEVVLMSDKSILDEALTALGDVAQLQEEEKRLSALIEQGSYDDDLINHYGQVCHDLEQFDMATERARVQRILAGLGFSNAAMEAPVNTLSVGWKMRLVLAKLLIQKADFYLFDEPTNHLDIFAKEWFLKFLKSAPFGFLLVSHERYFLDEVCDYILELERGKGTVYTGNYSSYVEQKAERDRLQLQAYIQQQKDIQRKQETIDRFKASASRAKGMQSMMKSLDRIERIEPPADFNRKIVFKFGSLQQAGKVVLRVNDVDYSFEQKQIFDHVSFEIERGHKVALVAANGVGKTTLFNVIAGIYPKQHGSIEFGYNVKSALFEQDQLRALDANKTVLEEVSYACAKKTESEIRACLGAFLFSGDDVLKKIKVLSGGERNRVAMVKVLLQDANFLMLDEPTNHLDITSKELLLKALQEYPGTILFVSHDRDFVNQLATNIIELTPQGTHAYQGNYDSFIYQKEHANRAKDGDMPKYVQPKQEQVVSSKERFELKKASNKLESKIGNLAKNKIDLQLKMAALSYGSDDYNVLLLQLNALENEIQNYTQQWELMQTKLET